MKKKRNLGKPNIFIMIALIPFLIIMTIIFLWQKKDNNTIINEETQANYAIANGEYTLQLDNNITIIPEDNNINIYKEDYKINIEFFDENFTDNKYQIEYGTNQKIETENVNENDMTISISLEEGINNIIVNIKQKEDYICKWNNKIYCIEPYKKQYLDELEINGYSCHFGYPWNSDNISQVSILKNLGVNYIRDDIRWNLIEKQNGEYDYSKYDKWIEEIYKNDIKIIGILGYPDQLIGSDKKISSQEELDKFLKFVESIISRYNGKIMSYELWNEPNTLLLTEEDINWYGKAVKGINYIINKINPEIELSIGALRTDGVNTEYFNTSDNIIKSFYNNNLEEYSDNISLHIYQYKGQNVNNYYKTVLEKHLELFNDLGGFQEVIITEQGASTYKEGVDEEGQSFILVTQSILDDQIGIDSDFKYSFRDLESSNSNDEESMYNFGSIKDSYEPKKAYYAMKNYYENTNGAEYIGTVNIADGLEAHVYDKDGKPKIIAWSDNSNNTIQIQYKNFTAKDLYGNDIQNTDGTLSIGTSPVYLDNISTNYFYQAIENTILEKYKEFEEKFGAEIAKVSGLQEKIDFLKQYVSSLSDLEEEIETVARTKMEEHFDLGNMILTAYKNKELDVEYVKLSSMLDMLNDIGNSYEDLVTVSAVTRNPDLPGIKAVIDETEQAINNNTDLEIVYPTKILEFSKDLYEKAEYINNLEEENDIKTGLIVSYALHADYLAEWSNTFANIYIDEYIENNPITENYSEIELTNKDVTVTLNIGEDTKITNNEGKNTYTFEENGTFTFEYERRGRKDSKKIEVNYIDKVLPEISGVENGTTYFETIIPNVEDEHLKSAQLTLNGQVVKNYGVGNKITQKGIYELTATDRAGNVSKVEFYILEDQNGYQIKNGNIVNINPNTTLEMFKEIFTVIGDYTIKHNDNELNSDDYVSTGDILEWGNEKKLTIAVKADINGDGKLSLADISISRKYLLQIQDINEIQRLATDINLNGNTSLSDISLMRKMILGIK